MRLALPFAAFFLSGASSLVFQTLWTRLLHHVFGSTSVAMSSVLTVFMAGLGLGAFISGRYVDRIKRPLLVYAIAELGVALFGILIPLMVQSEGWLADVNAALRENLGSESTGFHVVRFLCVVPILIVPTTLMGATLPLLARHFIDREAAGDAATMSAGRLYAINTAGAIFGTFMGGFVLMPKLGLAAANWAAVITNAVLGVVVGLWALRAPLTRMLSTPLIPAPLIPDGLRPDPPPAEVNPEPFGLTPFARRLALFAFAASGAAALCYEVVWSRALAMVLGSSIYSFTLILMTFLTGIAAGSAFLASCLAQRPTVWAPAAGALLLTGLAHVPLGIAYGVLAWMFTTVMCGLVIGAVALVMRDRGRPILATLLMLTVPVASALIEALAFGGDWPKVSMSVIVSVSLFLLLPLVTRKRPFMLLAALQAFIGLATFVSYLWQDSIPGTFARLVADITDLPNKVGTVQFFMFLTSALCTLPATLGMGAMFPLTLRLWAPSGQNIARDVGTVYTVNTVGAIAGAWLPGFVLLPIIGMEMTLQLGIGLNFGLGVLMLAIAAWRMTPRTPLRVTAALVAAACLPLSVTSLVALGSAEPGTSLRWRQSEMTLGAFRVSRMRQLRESDDLAPPEIVYYKDGVSTTVTVERVDGYHSLKNNGKADASDVPGGDMYTQVALAGFPLLLHPKAPDGLDVAIIGFGSGVTVGTALRFPVKSVDAIELEPAVLEAAKFFAKVNDLKFTDQPPYAYAPRLKVRMDDARNYLASTRESYDLIISEPSNPWITGVSDLFTEEHFRISKKRLRPGGLYVQWVQLYEVSPENIKTIYRTFGSQFAHVMVFAAAPFFDDTLLIGSDSPFDIDLKEIERRLGSSPAVKAAMEQADVLSAYDLPARVLIKSKDEMMQYTQLELRRSKGRWVVYNKTDNAEDPPAGARRYPAPTNTDDNARIEFAAPRDLIGYERYQGYTDVFFTEEWPYGRQEGLTLAKDPAAGARFADLAMAFVGHGRFEEASAFVASSQQRGADKQAAVAARVIAFLAETDPVDPQFTLTSNEAGMPLSEAQIQLLQKLFDESAEELDAEEYDAALERVDAFLEAHPKLDCAPVRFLRGYVLYQGGANTTPPWEDAIAELTELANKNPTYATAHPELYYFAARAYERNEQTTSAARWMRRYAELVLAAEARGERPPPAAKADEAEGDAGAESADAQGEEKTEEKTEEKAAEKAEEGQPQPTEGAPTMEDGTGTTPGEPADEADAPVAPRAPPAAK